MEYEEVSKILVRIPPGDSPARPFPGGTGFIVSPDGFAFTCAHVLGKLCDTNTFDCQVKGTGRDANNVQEWVPLTATVIHIWPEKELDFALIQVQNCPRVPRAVITPEPPAGGKTDEDEMRLVGIAIKHFDINNMTGMYNGTIGFNSRIPLLNIEKCFVTDGMSGGPAWHSKKKKIIGIIRGRRQGDPVFQVEGVPLDPARFSLCIPMSLILKAILNLKCAKLARFQEEIRYISDSPYFGELTQKIREVRSQAPGENPFLTEQKPPFVDPPVQKRHSRQADRDAKEDNPPENLQVMTGIQLVGEYCARAGAGPLIVLGDMGAGKSTFLARVEQQLLDDFNNGSSPKDPFSGRVPVFLKAADLEPLVPNNAAPDAYDPNPLYRAFFWHLNHLAGNPISIDTYDHWVREGRLFFLVDGLDQAPFTSFGGPRQFAAYAATFAKIGAGTNRILLAGRASVAGDFPALAQTQDVYVLQKWDEPNILAFLVAVFLRQNGQVSREKAEHDARALWEDLRAIYNLGDLCQTPFLLAAIMDPAILDEIRDRHSRGEEIHRATIYEMLIQQRIASNAELIPNDLSWLGGPGNHIKLWNLCQHLAWEVMANPELEISLDNQLFSRLASNVLQPEDRKALTRYPNQDNEFRQMVKANLLFDASSGSSKVQFRHQSLAEYLVARMVRDELKNPALQGKVPEHFKASHFTVETLDFLCELLLATPATRLPPELFIPFIKCPTVSRVDRALPWAILAYVYREIDLVKELKHYDRRDLPANVDQCMHLLGTTWQFSTEENRTSLAEAFLQSLVQNFPQLILKGLQSECQSIFYQAGCWNKSNAIFSLDISHWGLQRVPDFVWKLKSLRLLDLAYNELITLPPGIGQLQSLQSLDLSGNKLQTLPPEIGQLQSLQSLDLSGNKLQTLPPWIGQLRSLESLVLDFNKLRTLPPWIGQLQCLQSLALSGNTLHTLPPEIGHLQSLESLVLDLNELRTLPPGIGHLQSLRLLALRNNKLRTLPPWIGQLQSLESLDLTNNELRSVPPGIGQLLFLESLDLGSNELRSVPPGIGQILFLQSLDLSGNKLQTLQHWIGQLESLQSLDLSGNKLQTLPHWIGQLESLQSLDLRGNKLHTLPSEIRQLQSIRLLTLRNNELRTLPPGIGQLQSLKSLDLRNNELRTLPPWISRLRKRGCEVLDDMNI